MKEEVKKRNKWINGAIPALLLHLSVGSVYAFSLFINSISEYMNVSHAQVQFTFSLAIFFLGMSAAFGGKLVEKNITKSAIIGTICFCSGMILSGFAVLNKSIFELYLSYGVLGGIGLGITYLTPCKTLMLHFNKNKGMAMGLSVMGFGFASTIASPIITGLLKVYSVSTVLIIMGTIYLIPMIIGTVLLKKPLSFENIDKSNNEKFNYLKLLKDPFFVLCWLMFFLNIHCGLSLIGVASPIMANYGINIKTITLIVSIMGICNGLGRIVFSTIGDFLKKRIHIYIMMFLLSMAVVTLYILNYNTLTIAIMFCAISSFYGAGFSNIAPLLSDKYSIQDISKIHGAILSAWGIAGLTGNMTTTIIFEKTQSYHNIFSLLIILYFIALICAEIILIYTEKKKG